MSFDVTKIQAGLMGLVGIRNPLDPAYNKIDAANQGSRSGLFLDEEIPFFKVKYFVDTQDYAEITDLDLNIKLRNIQGSAIASVCQEVFGQISYIDRNLIYKNASTRITPESTLVNGFVGFKIKPSATKNVAFKITQLRIELDGAGDVDIVLFNSAENIPIRKETVTISSEYQIVTLNWVVNNTDGDYKGEYFLGYKYDGTLVPFERDYENSIIESNISELDIERVYVPGANSTTLFDLDQVNGLSENTGLNPDITVFFDYTDMILQNDFLFAKAIQYQYAISIMTGYASTSRSDRNARISKELIAHIVQQINGSVPESSVKVIGLSSILFSEVKRLRKTIDELKSGYFGSGNMVQTLS
jgi:hypothetical protein